MTPATPAAVVYITTSHPIIVEFATVMLLVTPINLIIWSHIQTASWHAANFLLALGGAIFASLAYPTGVSLASRTTHTGEMARLLSLHHNVALLTLILAWLLVAMLILIYFKSKYPSDSTTSPYIPYWPRFVIIAVSFAVAGCVAYTARLGFLMSWGAFR